MKDDATTRRRDDATYFPGEEPPRTVGTVERDGCVRNGDRYILTALSQPIVDVVDTRCHVTPPLIVRSRCGEEPLV